MEIRFTEGSIYLVYLKDMKTLFILLVSSLILSGCAATPSSQTETQTSPSTESEKSGFTTQTGKLTVKTKSTALLQTTTGSVELESYEIDFTPYGGKTVSVTGKFSGDTLFASSVTETQ